jgi:hypothetical protein
MKRYIFSIAISNLLDIVLSTILNVLLVMAVIKVYNIPNNVNILLAYIDTVQSHSGLFIISFLAGATASIIAGYTGAKIAKDHSLLMGGLSSVICLYGALGSFQSNGVVTSILLVIASPILGAYGGYLFKRKKSI